MALKFASYVTKKLARVTCGVLNVFTECAKVASRNTLVLILEAAKFSTFHAYPLVAKISSRTKI